MSQAEAYAARQLLKQQNVGVLSTHSVDVEGYPFGSIASYTLTSQGEPMILISDLAQHTRNIKNNPKVSLTIFDRAALDAQASGRLTWIGDAERLPESDSAARRRYLAFFPQAESYFQMHDFALYALRLKRARFIGGFGRIHWIEPHDMVLANPLADIEEGIVAHMNQDHHDSLVDYCRVLKGVEAENVRMAGMDSEGFDMLADQQKLRFDFEAPVTTAEDARAVLVKMARECRMKK